ncbi:MAG TPA: response regulator [Bacteroidota bacterium]|nr:response regulator [Bacteroidota bacterium]
MGEPALELKILVVDDEPTYRLVLATALRNSGHTVEICSSGSEAVAILKEEHFDLILLDYMMPGISGINLLQWMYGMRMNTPTILITGHGSEEIATEAWKWGAIDYFVKGQSDVTQLPALVMRVYQERKKQTTE